MKKENKTSFKKGHKAIGGYFKKGHIGFNKGKRLVEYKMIKCFCGNKFEVRKTLNRKNCSKKCMYLNRPPKGNLSDETKRKIGLSNSVFYKKFPEKIHTWKGGITPLNKIIRGSIEYRLWKIAVFTRDNYTCVECGDKSKKGHRIEVNADHIKPFAYYPELRFAIDNGRTLCKPCHAKTDSYGWKGRYLYVKN